MAIYNPEPKKISQLFSNITYEIPKYQRPYKWNNEQLEKLWDDIKEAFDNYDKENDNEYFLGTIVVVGDENKREKRVIDGQQRLTTLFIMTNVLSKFYPKINENTDDANDINLAYLTSMLKNNIGRPSLKVRDRDDANFDNYVIDITEDKVANYKVTNKELKDKEDSTPNYKNTVKFFYENFKKIDNIDAFVNFIYNNITIIRINCLDESSAIKVFQTINDTGLDLSIADIIKVAFISKLGEESSFETTWSLISKSINDIDLSLDNFLMYYILYHKEENLKKGITSEYQDLIKKCAINEEAKEEGEYTINDIVNKMKLFADKVVDVFNSDDKIIYSLRYLRWDTYINTIMATIELCVPDELKSKYYNLVRKFYYYYFIAGKTQTSVKQSTFNIISHIKHKTYEELESLLNNKIKEDNVIYLVKENLNSNYVFGESWLKPIMLSYDYILDDGKGGFVPINSELNIDHIIPKEWNKNSWWNSQIINNVDETNAKLNSLGNMALLSEHKNKGAQNEGLDIKQYRYLGLSSDGKQRLEGATQFVSSKDVIDSFRVDNKWNYSKLENRAKSLIKGIYNLLELNE